MTDSRCSESSAFLGIDQGSQSTKAVVLDCTGRELFRHSVTVSTSNPSADVYEQDASELVESVQQVIDVALQWSVKEQRTIVCLGLACQQSGVLAWDCLSTEACSPVLTWRDLRTQDHFSGLLGKRELIQSETGLPLNAHYAGTKLALLQSEFQSRDIEVGTLDSFLALKLSGDRTLRICRSAASRSLLYSLHSMDWSEQLCDLFGVDHARLPQLKSCLSDWGSYRDIPIQAVIGDQQAGYLGLAHGFDAILLNMGTVSTVLRGRSTASVAPGCVSMVLATADDLSGFPLYGIAAHINASGGVLSYIKAKQLVESESDIDLILLNRTPSASVGYFPLGGTATPLWRSNVPCAVVNWDRDNSAGLLQSLIENIGSFVVSSIAHLREQQVVTDSDRELFVSGGVSRSDYLLQYIADCSGMRIRRLCCSELSARGAVVAAMLAGGVVSNVCDLRAMTEDRHFSPGTSGAQERYHIWCELQQRALACDLRKDERYDP